MNFLTSKFAKDNLGLETYHGTFKDIDSFLPLSHFGSYRASMERVTTRSGTICIPAGRKREEFCPEQARIYQVNLNIVNPIEIGDVGVQHHVSHFVDLLVQKFPDNLDFNRLQSSNVTQNDLIAAVRKSGHDGFVYFNHSEDKGSEAFVILDSEQVTIKEIYDYNDIIRNLRLHGEGFSPRELAI